MRQVLGGGRQPAADHAQAALPHRAGRRHLRPRPRRRARHLVRLNPAALLSREQGMQPCTAPVWVTLTLPLGGAQLFLGTKSHHAIGNSAPTALSWSASPVMRGLPAAPVAPDCRLCMTSARVWGCFSSVMHSFCLWCPGCLAWLACCPELVGVACDPKLAVARGSCALNPVRAGGAPRRSCVRACIWGADFRSARLQCCLSTGP